MGTLIHMYEAFLGTAIKIKEQEGKRIHGIKLEFHFV
jgi:hypothetical protein